MINYFEMSYSEKNVIKASKGSELLGKKITLCVTGSVSAYRAIDLARELIRHGADVYVVMSKDSQLIVHPYAFEWATGNPVVTEITGKVEHIFLAEEVDLILVAPATANTIAKVSQGISDTPVTLTLTVALGVGVPVLMVPAMHEPMYENPILMEALERLRKIGVRIMPPRREEAKAKFPEIEDIVFEVMDMLYIKDLKGRKFLITAGPTLEYIDRVRILTNKSSGKMGVYLAREAYLRGADVTLIIGNTDIDVPSGIKRIRVETTEEMHKMVLDEVANGKYDVFISAAAPVDYKPAKEIKSKIDSRRKKKLEIEFVTTPKIVETVKEKDKDIYVVAFKAVCGLDDEEIIKKAVKYAADRGFELVVANDVCRPGVGFAEESNEVFIVDSNGLVEHIPITSKKLIASKILDLVRKNLESK